MQTKRCLLRRIFCDNSGIIFIFPQKTLEEALLISTDCIFVWMGEMRMKERGSRVKMLVYYEKDRSERRGSYSKCPKISDTLFHIILAYILLFMQLFLKILSGMANSVDPDQTAPSLFAYVILSDTLVFEILGHLPYISHILKKFTHSRHNLCLSNLNLLYPLKWLVGLEFNAPVNTIKVLLSQSVYLTTLFLGRKPVLVHILLPETDNCTSWISNRESMTMESIS